MTFPSSRRPRASRPARLRPALEALEDRLAPAVSLADADTYTYAQLIGDSASPSSMWQSFDQALDSAGNRYVLGERYGGPDCFLARFDSGGNLDATFGSGGSLHFASYQRGHALAIDGSDNIYVVLDQAGDGGTSGNAILKLDTSGTTLSAYTAETRNLGGCDIAIADVAPGVADLYLTAGGFTARFESTLTGLVKQDEYAIGGTALAVAPSGDRVYVVGTFSGSNVDFDPVGTHADNRDLLSTSRQRGGNWYPAVFTLELAPNATTGALEFVWVGTTSPHGYNLVHDVVTDGPSTYVLGSYQVSGSGYVYDFDPGPGQAGLPINEGDLFLTGGYFLTKLDSANQFEWVKGLIGWSATEYGPGQLALDDAGNVYVASSTTSGSFDFDIERSYAGDVDRLSGLTSSTTFLATYSPEGVFRWAATAAGADLSQGLDVNASGAHLAAWSGSPLTFSPDLPGGSNLAGDPMYGSLVLARYTQTADAVRVSVKRVDVTEGNTGTTPAVFTVQLSQPSTSTVTVSYSTANGTATVAGNDYFATSGTLTFNPGGPLSQAVTVSVRGDTASEGYETFFLDLTVSGADVTTGSIRGLGTIVNDDASKGKKLTAASLGANAEAAPLAAGQAEPLLQEALARWQAAGADTASLAGIQVRITDLGGLTLGMASGNTIWLDDDAAGWGWFVDPTPWDDSEFLTPGDQGEQGRMDLLTVLLHEMGHLLGHEHEDEGVMHEVLGAGSREGITEHHATIDAVFSAPVGAVASYAPVYWGDVLALLSRKKD